MAARGEREPDVGGGRHERADVVGGGGRHEHVGRAGDVHDRDRHGREVDEGVGTLHLAGGELVAQRQPLVDLQRGPPGVGQHVVHDVVDRLHLTEELPVLALVPEGAWLLEVRRQRGRLEADAHHRRGDRPGRLEGAADQPAPGHLRHGLHRAEQRLLRQVERAGHHRDRTDRQVRVDRDRAEREQAAHAPADEVDVATAGVLGHFPDGRRQHVVDEVLDADLAVLALERAVVDEVRRPAPVDEVLGQRQPLPQVEAGGLRAERWHEEHRDPLAAHALRLVVAVQLPGPADVDDLRRGPGQVGDAALDQEVPEVDDGLLAGRLGSSCGGHGDSVAQVTPIRPGRGGCTATVARPPKVPNLRAIL